MALPLLETIEFTKGLLEALPFFEGIVSRSPAATAAGMLREARDAGLAFRDSAAYQLVGQLKRNADLLSRFKVSNPNEIPSDSVLGAAVTDLKKNYSYTVEIKGFNALAGQREVRHVTIVSNNALSIADVFDTALNLPSGRPGSQALTNETLDITKAHRSSLLD